VLINVKAMLRLGDTLVPYIFMSDRRHFSIFAGYKNEWLVYMTIGNLSSKVRQMTSTHTVIMVTLLSIPSKHHDIPQKWMDDQCQTNQEVLKEVPRLVFQPLTITQNPGTESRYYNILFADDNIQPLESGFSSMAWRLP